MIVNNKNLLINFLSRDHISHLVLFAWLFSLNHLWIFVFIIEKYGIRKILDKIAKHYFAYMNLNAFLQDFFKNRDNFNFKFIKFSEIFKEEEMIKIAEDFKFSVESNANFSLSDLFESHTSKGLSDKIQLIICENKSSTINAQLKAYNGITHMSIIVMPSEFDTNNIHQKFQFFHELGHITDLSKLELFGRARNKWEIDLFSDILIYSTFYYLFFEPNTLQNDYLHIFVVVFFFLLTRVLYPSINRKSLFEAELIADIYALIKTNSIENIKEIEAAWTRQLKRPSFFVKKSRLQISRILALEEIRKYIEKFYEAKNTFPLTTYKELNKHFKSINPFQDEIKHGKLFLGLLTILLAYFLKDSHYVILVIFIIILIRCFFRYRRLKRTCKYAEDICLMFFKNQIKEEDWDWINLFLKTTVKNREKHSRELSDL